jgi:hypothetical protein
MIQNMPDSANLIVLCAPRYDKLTEYTSKLFDHFSGLSAPVKIEVFDRAVTYEQLLSDLNVNSSEDVALIFCGHGRPSLLQGPPDDINDEASAFYDADLVEDRPKYMLAFCCSAGAGIGDAYARLTNDSTFVGFKRKLPIVTVDGIYAEWWKKIVYELASAVLNSPDLETLENSIEKLYKEAIRFFHLNEKRYEWARAMKWYLHKHSEIVRAVKT